MRITHRSSKNAARRALARAWRTAPTQASRQELLVLQGLGR